ncbi:MAG TPA: precorrin-6y C5,15-methyltransferase (decarboxylating) subunit CbiE [Acidimicrobiales bacterium]|nr:precorrin-6y C5,15-methyltransferase (decarboxylating) subunit CbiE [Acidimicrobiales bacterium]
MAEPPVVVVGLQGGEWFGASAGAALREADVLAGAPRHLAALPHDLPGERRASSSVDELVTTAAAARSAGRRACLVASGDPGFFGIVRLAAARLGPGALAVHPAPSAVSLAFARLGCSWDDAVVVSAHGRPLHEAVVVAAAAPKAAVLTAPGAPPESLGRALVAAGCGPRQVAVCVRLGEPSEAVAHTDLDGLASGSFDPLAVVVLRTPALSAPTLAWGRPDRSYSHRHGMITKAEVRAVALGKLALPPAGVLWDVGAGSGSVGIECARLAPGLAVYALERRAGEVERIRANAAGTPSVRAVHGEAPAALAALPDPDRAFVGGGGLGVLDAVLARLRPGGVVVATYASLDRAASAARRLGSLVQVAVSRGMPVGPDGGLRLAAENPVFVCWGPS